MAKLNLMQTIVTFQGKPIVDDITNQPVYIKDMLLQYLGTFTSKNGQDLIAASILGQKIYQCETEFFEADEQDLQLILKTIETPQHIALAYGQLAAVINETLKSSENDKVVGLKQTAKS